MFNGCSGRDGSTGGNKKRQPPRAGYILYYVLYIIATSQIVNSRIADTKK